jgi:hypothetical protein
MEEIINGEKLEVVNIRTSIDDIENFNELGQNIKDNGLDNAKIIKNTKNKCIIDLDNIRFTITYKKNKKYVIFILTPSFIESFKIIDKKDLVIEKDIAKQINKKKIEIIGIKDNIENFHIIRKSIIGFLKKGLMIKNNSTECIIDLDNIRFTITYKKDKKFVIYVITPTPIIDKLKFKTNIKVPMDHSLNKKQVEKYIQASDLNTQPILRKIFDNTKHISFEVFIKELNKNIEDLISTMKDNKDIYFYISFVYKNKSNYWIFLYIQDYLKFYHKDYVIHIIQDLNNNKNGDFIVFVDDCIYSGSQLGNSISYINNNNKLKLNIFILCSYISSLGLNKIKHRFEINPNLKGCKLIINKFLNNLPLINDYLTDNEMREINKYMFFMCNNKFLIYFDHKLADNVSTITNIYSGYVLNKKNAEILKSVKDKNNADIIPVINNCQNTKNLDTNNPSCPFTPYKETFKEFIKKFKLDNSIVYKTSPLKPNNNKIIINKSA